MSTVFQAQTVSSHTDYPTADEAATAVEAAGSGSVVKFHVERNMPGCLPEFVYRSCALWTLDGGVWTARSIFGGTADSMGVERPGSDAIHKAILAKKPFTIEVHVTAYGQDFWNDSGNDLESNRYRTRAAAEKAMAKTIKMMAKFGSASEYRVRDTREAI
jgi:hypothetical protein